MYVDEKTQFFAAKKSKTGGFALKFLLQPLTLSNSGNSSVTYSHKKFNTIE
jgi:hypothetical protein